MPESITLTNYTDYGSNYKDKKSIESLKPDAFFKLGTSGWVGDKYFPRTTVIPNFMDVDLSEFDTEIFQSGVGKEGLQLTNLTELHGLHLVVTSGWFSSFDQNFRIFSDDALYTIPTSDSPLELKDYASNSNFSAKIYQYQDDDKVSIYRSFRINLNEDDVDNYQALITVGNQRRLHTGAPSGGPLKSITLPSSANTNRNIRTKYPDLFRKRVTTAPNSFGEWWFSNATTIQYYDNLGVSPSIIEIEYWEVSHTLTPLTSWFDTTYFSEAYNLGNSNGEAYQTFTTPIFPISNVSVLVNGVAWTVTESPITTSGNYVFVNPSSGVIQFGGGGNYGTIPNLGSSIKVTFKGVPLICYEPSYSSKNLTIKSLDISVPSTFDEFGYIAVTPNSREEVMRLDDTDVNSITLSLASGTTPGTPLLCTVSAQDLFGRPVRNTIIKLMAGFNLSGANLLSNRMLLGEFSSNIVRTNSEGAAYTYFTPSSNIYSYMIRCNFYNRGMGEAFNGSRGTSLSGLFLNTGNIIVTLPSHPEVRSMNISTPSNIRVVGIYDDDKWNPYNYESRTGGRVKLIRDSLGNPATPGLAILNSSFLRLDITNIRSLMYTSSLVQIGILPAQVSIWCVLNSNTTVVSNVITRGIDIINESTLNGPYTVGTDRIQQLAYLDPTGEITWT